MKSRYERDNFIKLFWLVAGCFLVTSFAVLIYIGLSISQRMIPALILVGVTEVVMIVVAFLFSKKYVDTAYDSLDGASDIMMSMIEDSKQNQGRILSDEEMEKGEKADYSQFRPLHGAGLPQSAEVRAAKETLEEEKQTFHRSR